MQTAFLDVKKKIPLELKKNISSKFCRERFDMNYTFRNFVTTKHVPNESHDFQLPSGIVKSHVT